MKAHLFCGKCGVGQGEHHRPWCVSPDRVFRYYLSAQDLEDRHAEVEEHFGDDVGCGGTFSFNGPPCGGCVDCAHAMTSHYFSGEVRKARMFQRAGFEYADERLIDISAMMKSGGSFRGFEKHGVWDCRSAKEEERWPRYVSSLSSTGSGEASTA